MPTILTTRPAIVTVTQRSAPAAGLILAGAGIGAYLLVSRNITTITEGLYLILTGLGVLALAGLGWLAWLLFGPARHAGTTGAPPAATVAHRAAPQISMAPAALEAAIRGALQPPCGQEGDSAGLPHVTLIHISIVAASGSDDR
jgi:hypothetical protein